MLQIGAGARVLLDAGCGPASMLRGLADLGMDLYGFDLTPEMVEVAKQVVGQFGMSPEHIWQGSVADAASFRSAQMPAVDATICVGVFPHIPESIETDVIAHLRDSVRRGGFEPAGRRGAPRTIGQTGRQYVPLTSAEAPRAGRRPQDDSGHPHRSRGHTRNGC